MDQGSKRLLIGELTKPGILVQLVRAVWNGGKLLVAFGWVGVFLGLGIWLAGGYRSEENGAILGLLSFGVLTVPFAMRELDARRQT